MTYVILKPFRTDKQTQNRIQIGKSLIASKSLSTIGEDMVKIVIDYAKCVEDLDKICVEICPVSVFRNGKLEKPEVVNQENCIMCRTCEVNCPGQAIKILT
jgi:2-oxoglutarate ferredoxin oxidoreductase subunit delta